MTTEQLQQELKTLEAKYNQDRDALYKQKAITNNPYKKGDVVTDHMGSIRIESIKWAKMSFREDSECVYEGVELKKDLTPKKRDPKRRVWQSNIGKKV